MSLAETVKQMYRENYRLITTDRMLQKFMVGVFILLISIIVYCKFFGDFQEAEYYYTLAGEMLEGEFSYDALGTDLPPLILLLLIPPRLFSLNPEMYCVLFSVYGFAFYMLGGHFMLKSCRETGFPEKDAYILLFMFFICSLSFMTLSGGPIASAFVIISLWFYHRKQYLLAFPALGLATMAGFYPILLFMIYVCHLALHKEIRNSIPGIITYSAICGILLVFPTWSGTPPYFGLPEYCTCTSYLGMIYDWFEIDVHSSNMVIYSFILATVFIVCCTVRMKKRPIGMYEASLTFEIALIMILAMSPVYSAMYPIWIIMLFPMCQMTSVHFTQQKMTYGILAAFCIMTLVCDTALDPEDSIFQVASLVRVILLATFGILLAKELKSILD